MLARTEESDAEVIRNLAFTADCVAGLTVLGTALLTFAIDPRMGAATGFGVYFIGAFCLPLLAFAGSTMTLIYLGCWPAFLRTRIAAELYGIGPARLSQAALRGRACSPYYWLDTLKGVAVGGVFAAIWFLGIWTLRGEEFPNGLVGPAMMIAAYSGGIASRAWVVRQVVSEHRAGVAS